VNLITSCWFLANLCAFRVVCRVPLLFSRPYYLVSTEIDWVWGCVYGSLAARQYNQTSGIRGIDRWAGSVLSSGLDWLFCNDRGIRRHRPHDDSRDIFRPLSFCDPMCAAMSYQSRPRHRGHWSEFLQYWLA
jgi:hypothetical protein